MKPPCVVIDITANAISLQCRGKLSQRNQPTLFTVILKYDIQNTCRATVDISVRLAIIRFPEYIGLNKALLECIFRKRIMDL